MKHEKSPNGFGGFHETFFGSSFSLAARVGGVELAFKKYFR